MKEVYLLLGSNKGNRLENLNEARKLVASNCGNIIKTSSLYETAAWGLKEQEGFINQAIMIETKLAPKALITELKSIEKKIGREETIKWGPRIIDIDILFYGNEIIDTPLLKIPHPLLQERKFTLVPLNEIAGSLIHPLIQKNVAQLLVECKDELPVTKLA